VKLAVNFLVKVHWQDRFDAIPGRIARAEKARHNWGYLRRGFIMKRFLVAAALMSLGLTAGPATARNYDCSKPGNATKTACKGKATAAGPATAASAPAKAATVVRAKKVAATPVTATRNYDCSKVGNANKAVCKNVVAAPHIVAAPAGKAAAAPAPKVTAAPAPRSVAAPAAVRPAVAAGAATGKCRDGSVTRATNHRGACSHHGGVAAWY
jgi:hypothetical protein